MIRLYFHQVIFNTNLKSGMYWQLLSVAAGIILLVLIFCSANVSNVSYSGTIIHCWTLKISSTV